MTSFNDFTGRNRDQQDGYERGLWGELEYVNGAGAVLKVRGTGVEGGTLDEEVPLLNTGYGFNVPKDYNTEVIMLATNSDTTQKMVVASLPRDKQRPWPLGTGGVQHPTDPDKFIQLDDDSIWLKDGRFVLGDGRELSITVNGNDVTISASGTINFVSAQLQHNGVNIGDTHVHSQGADSGGDAEPDTDVPH